MGEIGFERIDARYIWSAWGGFLKTCGSLEGEKNRMFGFSMVRNSFSFFVCFLLCFLFVGVQHALFE